MEVASLGIGRNHSQGSQSHGGGRRGLEVGSVGNGRSHSQGSQSQGRGHREHGLSEKTISSLGRPTGNPTFAFSPVPTLTATLGGNLSTRIDCPIPMPYACRPPWASGRPFELHGPGPRTHARPRCSYARSRLVGRPIPRQHTVSISRQTRQEIVRLLMCRWVCLKARADTGRGRAVTIRNLHSTVTCHVTNCDGGRRTI